jgi:hypothetical protein
MTFSTKARRALRAVIAVLVAIVAAAGLYLLAHLALQDSHRQEFQPLIEDTRSLVKGKTVLSEDDPMWAIYGYKRTELPDDVRVTCQIDYIEGYIWGDVGKVYTSDSIACYNHDGDVEYASGDGLVEWAVSRDAQGRWRIEDVHHVDMGESRLVFGIPHIWK